MGSYQFITNSLGFGAPNAMESLLDFDLICLPDSWEGTLLVMNVYACSIT